MVGTHWEFVFQFRQRTTICMPWLSVLEFRFSMGNPEQTGLLLFAIGLRDDGMITVAIKPWGIKTVKQSKKNCTVYTKSTGRKVPVNILTTGSTAVRVLDQEVHGPAVAPDPVRHLTHAQRKNARLPGFLSAFHMVRGKHLRKSANEKDQSKSPQIHTDLVAATPRCGSIPSMGRGFFSLWTSANDARHASQRR